MRMEQYLTHTDYALWEVIVNVDAPAVASASAEGPILPKTAEQKLARKNELKAKNTLLLAIPDEHLLKFHGIKDAKTLWEAIKARFGGNKESKKMQKTILKQQYENFAASRSKRLDKTYDRFQKLISQLEIHGEVISQEDENMKLLRSLPLTWNNIALIMRNKSDLDTLSMDDLYNNLKVYESEIKGQSSSSLNSQNMAFVSSENTSSTNEAVNTAHEVSTASSQGQASSSTYADDERSFARECKAPRNQGNRNRDAPRRNAPVDTSTTNALVVQDRIGYQMGLESLESKIVIHVKNEAVYEEDIAFLKYDVQVKDISIKDLKNQLEEALKEKNDLKLKLENFEESSKNLTKLINSQNRESDVDDSPVNDRFKTGEGFHAVPPPYTRNYMPSRPDLSFAGLDDSVYKTKVSETKTSISKTSKDIVEKPKTVRPSAPIIEDWDTDSDNDSVFRPKSDQTKPKLTKINFVKSNENVKFVNKENTHRQVEYPRKKKHVLNNKGRVTGQREIRPVWNNAQRVNHQNKLTHPHPKRKFVPTTVLTKSGQVPVNVVKQSSTRAATSIKTARSVNTDAPKSKVNDALPKTYSYFKAHSLGNPQYTLQDQGIFDSRCSRHMTGNKSFLTDYQEIDGGFVAFGGSPKGGKITRKGKIRTGKLDFEDVYFVKELKFNLFSVSQMCDKKNNVLFTETEIDPQENFDKKADEGFFIGYSINRSRPDWLFDIDLLTNSMNYEPVTAGNQTNKNAGIKDNVDAVPTQQYILLPLLYNSPQSSEDAVADDAAELDNLLVQQKEGYANNINKDSTVSPSVSTDGQIFTNANDLPTYPLMSDLEDTADLLNTGIFSGAYDDEDVGAEAVTKVWRLVDLPKGKHAIGTKWVYRNKKVERGMVVRNKARLVIQGYTQEEGIDYDEVFAPVARIEKFDFVTMKTISTPIETNKAFFKDEEAEDVDVHLYKSMIGSLMYLTAFRPDIMFDVCACARDSPFDLEAFSDCDYAGASLDRKSTT
ncbi:ribonuclease H-like domain-containing protein [Tanacetum coccineum]